MYSLPIVNGSVTVNDILNNRGGRFVGGGGKGNATNSKFNDLGIPLGYLSGSWKGRPRTSNTKSSDIYTKSSVIDTKLFEELLKRII
jgi:hypothetical protein